MTKTLTIKDDVYRRLVAMKDPGESFSDLFSRFVEEGSSTATLRRLRGSVVFKEKEKLLSEISVRREERRNR